MLGQPKQHCKWMKCKEILYLDPGLTACWRDGRRETPVPGIDEQGANTHTRRASLFPQRLEPPLMWKLTPSEQSLKSRRSNYKVLFQTSLEENLGQYFQVRLMIHQIGYPGRV